MTFKRFWTTYSVRPSRRMPSPFGTFAVRELDLPRHALQADREELPGRRLDDDESLAVRKRVDAVQVEASTCR